MDVLLLHKEALQLKFTFWLRKMEVVVQKPLKATKKYFILRCRAELLRKGSRVGVVENVKVNFDQRDQELQGTNRFLWFIVVCFHHGLKSWTDHANQHSDVRTSNKSKCAPPPVQLVAIRRGLWLLL